MTNAIGRAVAALERSRAALERAQTVPRSRQEAEVEVAQTQALIGVGEAILALNDTVGRSAQMIGGRS